MKEKKNEAKREMGSILDERDENLGEERKAFLQANA